MPTSHEIRYVRALEIIAELPTHLLNPEVNSKGEVVRPGAVQIAMSALFPQEYPKWVGYSYDKRDIGDDGYADSF